MRSVTAASWNSLTTSRNSFIASQPGPRAVRAAILVSFSFALVAADLATLPGVHAQAGTIEGRVTDAISGLPLSGAQVSVEATSLLTLTNEAGRYRLQNVPAGRRTVSIELIGYAGQRMQVTVAPGQTTVLDIVLGTQIQLRLLRQRQPAAEASARSDQVMVTLARHLDFNTESYARIEENDFRLVSASPPLHLLDRRRPGFLCEHPALHPVRRPSARRRGTHRGDDQLLPLRLEQRVGRTPLRGHHRGVGGSVEA